MGAPSVQVMILCVKVMILYVKYIHIKEALQNALVMIQVMLLHKPWFDFVRFLSQLWSMGAPSVHVMILCVKVMILYILSST